jgi:hypothetical protein
LATRALAGVPGVLEDGGGPSFPSLDLETIAGGFRGRYPLCIESLVSAVVSEQVVSDGK